MGEAQSVTLERVSKSFGGGVLTVKEVDLHIAGGEFFTLLGPSGCGKTTTLRMIAGFYYPTTGRILFGDRDVTGPAAQPAEHRHGVPELRPVPAPDGVRERGLRPAGAQGVPRAEMQRRVAERSGPGAAWRAWAPAHRPALRRPAAAGRPGPGPGDPAGAAAAGRAALQPGREAAGRDAHRDPPLQRRPASPPSTSPTTRPRRWRSPTASPSWRAARSSRSGTPRGDLPPARHPLRGRLHRQVQPAGGPAGGGGRHGRPGGAARHRPDPGGPDPAEPAPVPTSVGQPGGADVPARGRRRSWTGPAATTSSPGG